ncbi:helix-turn-helix transcriptional regulator [Veillonella sp.]|uniref:helix-turn-helix domain-containing protein n=1 Tax=Veillonella sp. TaxID=1926307 RepID=UPI0025EC71D6|nr:helix-turn-helix transcriptional regulator [Veillonella sp.]
MDDKKSNLFKCIGAKVTYYRTLRGLTQRELATQIGISPSTLNKVERGTYNQNVSIAMLLDIAEGLNVDVTYFLSITEADKEVLF